MHDDGQDAETRLRWAELAIAAGRQRDASSGFGPLRTLADETRVRAYAIREFGVVPGDAIRDAADLCRAVFRGIGRSRGEVAAEADGWRERPDPRSSPSPRKAECMSETARLQIYSVESEDLDSAVCVVRCVGGVVRVGQEFAGPMTLDRILRYGRTVELLEPPHSAQVRLSGVAVRGLGRGVVLTALRTGE
ncbi:hypothetical protein [Streptomyces sp. NPDC048202]|uniref:hypothetical protein n=1 Tax=Streptomyces sp. NPDC048202 TaxID=3365514 RepID=UPI0037236144